MRAEFKVGDWVEFTDAHLRDEEDWSAVNGLIAIVTEVTSHKIAARPALGGKWPTLYGQEPTLDKRHFKRIVKKEEIVLDASPEPVLDSAHAPQED